MNAKEKQNSIISRFPGGTLSSKVVSIYVLTIFAVFPCFSTNRYYGILEDKFYFFWYATAAAAVLFLLARLTEGESGGQSEKTFKKAKTASAEKTGVLKALKARLFPSDYAALALLLATAVSTAFSEWPFEAFWGNQGRYQGLFLWIFYFIAYFLTAHFYEPKRSHFDVFLLAGLYVAGLAVLDYMGLDVRNWKEGSQDPRLLSFSSTIGNVNSLTAVLGVYAAVSAALFSLERKSIVRQLCYWLSTLVFFMGLIAGVSDNAVLSLAALFALLPFLAFRLRGGLRRWLLVLCAFCTAMGAVDWLTVLMYRMNIRFLPRGFRGLLLKLSIEHRKPWFCAALCLLAAVLLLWLADRAVKNGRMKDRLPAVFQRLWAAMLAAAAAAGIWVLADVNKGNRAELYKPYYNFLYFNDSWGTGRGYAWRLAWNYMKEFPLFNKLFGSGPETYAIYTARYDYLEMTRKTGVFYDSPHNEPLQQLFCVGILGFLSYMGMFLLSVWQGFRAGKELFEKDPAKASCYLAAAFAVPVYFSQSFINISVPIVFPFALMMLSIAASGARERGAFLNKK